MITPESSSGYVIVESVHTKAKGKSLLQPMVLDFPEGEIVAIMGPSGGGKSTLLDFITCSIQSNVIADGEVSLPGSLAYVPQDDRLHGFYTTKKYMEHYARLAGIKKSKERTDEIDAIIEQLGLSGQRDTIVGDIVSLKYVHALSWSVRLIISHVHFVLLSSQFRRGLSGGQKRRLSIGLEALSKPKNLFLGTCSCVALDFLKPIL